MRHEVTFMHGWQRLKEGMVTSTAKKAAALDGDPDVLSSNGLIKVQLRLYLMAVQLVVTAMDTLKRRSHQHHLKVKIMCLFIYYQNAKVRQAQEIQGRFSHCRVLPKKFSSMRVKPVARERRLQHVSCRYPTHFRDVEIVCRSVKNGAIPRGIAISRKIYFRSEGHKQRCLDALQQRRKIDATGTIDREYGAAYYILSADLATWERASDYIDREGIDFDAMLKGVDLSHGYELLVQLAANLFGANEETPDGKLIQIKVSPCDLIETLDENNFRVALTALQLRRYGANVKDLQ